MAPSASCIFVVGLLLGGALAKPIIDSSSISETQVPSVQTRVLPASTKPFPTQELADVVSKVSIGNSSLADKNQGDSGEEEAELTSSKSASPSTTSKAYTPTPPVRESLKAVEKRQEEAKPNVTSTALPNKRERVAGYTRSDGTFVVEDSADTPCVLAYFKAKITVAYPIDEKNKKYEQAVLRPPADVEVSGYCDRDSQMAYLDLTWKDGTLTLKFAFDSLTDSWYVAEFSFKFDTSTARFKKAETKEVVLVKSDKGKRFWATSHARSFRCLLLHDVIMKDKDDRYSGVIHFDEARVQALTKTSSFKTPKHCIHRVHRDEMVPVAVGGALAASTLLTIIGYAIFRYIKVKKFQYNTME